MGWETVKDKYDHEIMSTRFSEWQEDKNTTAGQCRE
jgi:hypothetical protein